MSNHYPGRRLLQITRLAGHASNLPSSLCRPFRVHFLSPPDVKHMVSLVSLGRPAVERANEQTDQQLQALEYQNNNKRAPCVPLSTCVPVTDPLLEHSQKQNRIQARYSDHLLALYQLGGLSNRLSPFVFRRVLTMIEITGDPHHSCVLIEPAWWCRGCFVRDHPTYTRILLSVAERRCVTG